MGNTMKSTSINSWISESSSIGFNSQTAVFLAILGSVVILGTIILYAVKTKIYHETLSVKENRNIAKLLVVGAVLALIGSIIGICQSF